MRKTEMASWHLGARLVIVAAGVAAMVALSGRIAIAGDAVGYDDEGDVRSTVTVTVPPGEEAGSEYVETVEVVDPCAADPSWEPEVPALWKLGRGLHNLVFGFPAEVLRNPVIEILKAETVFGVGAGAFEGVLLGVGKGFWRVGAGFLDIVTFPAPMAPWYDCRLLPEYPF